MDNLYDTTSIERGRRWVILAVICICVLAYAITLQSVPPVLSFIIVELGLSHTHSGLLMSFFALPGIIISIPAGLLSDRYNQKIIGVVSLSLMIAGTAIFALGSSMPILALGRVISGTGAMTFFVLAPKLLAQWFTGHKIGIAMGVFNTAVPLGTILSLNLLSIIGETQGWRFSIWLTAGFALVALVLFISLFAPAPKKGRQVSGISQNFFRSIVQSGTPILLVGTAWMLFNAVIISLCTFTPDLLIEIGFSTAAAGFLTSLIMWPAIELYS